MAPFKIGDNDLYLGAAVGVVIYPEHGENVDTLMSRADIAMYGSKNRDVGYLFYDAALDPNAQSRLQLATDLRHALERNELILHYQPKIDLQSGRIEGPRRSSAGSTRSTALSRRPSSSPLRNARGFINPITDWVIETAGASAGPGATPATACGSP